MVPVLITLVGIGVVLGCLYVMCIGKESRWRIGRVGEIFFGLIILATFIAAALPFANFAKVVERQDDIKGRIDTLMTSAKNLDAAYDAYVADRIQKYESQLNIVSRGKKVRPSDYQKLLAGAAGDTDSKKIANLSKSLKRQLLPESRDSICKQRMEWLERANQMSVWNILLPQNINKIAKEVNDYVKNYVEIEKIRFGDRLEVEYDIEATDFSVPPLSIQVIVENAIKHGIEKKVGGGTIKVSSGEDGRNIIVTIADNGVGFSDDDIVQNEKKNGKRKHVGIYAATYRLENLCGGKLEYSSKRGEGTTATITIPKN